MRNVNYRKPKDIRNRNIGFVMAVIAYVLNIALAFALVIALVTCFYSYNYPPMPFLFIGIIGCGAIAGDIKKFMDDMDGAN